MPAVAKWTCPSCGKRRATAFCPVCGEKPLRPRDLKLDDLAGQAWRAFSSIDGKLHSVRVAHTTLIKPAEIRNVGVEMLLH